MSNELKATKGPWNPVRKHPQVWGIDAPGGDEDVGHVRWNSLADIYGCDEKRDVGATKAKANAHLIAAAPEMYQELLEIRDWMNGYNVSGKYDAEIERIDSLLAKARGES